MRALPLVEFVQEASPDGLGLYRTEDGRWQARCDDVALRCPETGGASFADLLSLLAILAGAGVRCSRIEWDGLPAAPYAQSAPPAAPPAGIPEEWAMHPADTSIFVAAALRGYVLSIVPHGYRLERRNGGAQAPGGVLSFKEVANLCGATGTITLRKAAERDGLVWPDSPEAFIALFKNL